MLRQGVLSVLIIFQADKNSVSFLDGWYSRGTQRYRKNTDTKRGTGKFASHLRVASLASNLRNLRVT